jgi:thiol-disulfide isomerase/thioredoxin
MKTLAGILAITLASSFAHAEDVKWVTDPKAAFVEAKAEHRLVMVDLFTDWCVWCKRLDAGAYKDPKVVALSKQLVPLKSNAEKEGKDLNKKYAVAGYPTILFLSEDGTVVSKLVGYQPGPDFAETVETALASAKEFASVKKILAKNPNDGEANAKFVTFSSALSDPTTAQTASGEAYLKKALSSSYRGQYIVKALEAIGDQYATIPGGEAKAIGYYQQALQFATNPVQKSAALVAVMYLQMDKDKPAAKAVAQKLITLKDATPEWVDIAKDAIKEMDKG